MATLFIRTRRVSLLLLILTATAFPAILHAVQRGQGEVEGLVLDSSGKALAAVVFVHHATPKSATNTTLRYPALPDPVRTDQNGRFKLKGLDHEWFYYAAVAAPGHRPLTLPRITASEETVTARLTMIPENAGQESLLQGRVVDPFGKPMPQALIKITGVTRDGKMHWPASQIDGYAASDEMGRFAVYAEKSFTAAEGSVRAPGYAISLFTDLVPGSTVHELTLKRGATLSGRVVQSGKPVADVTLRLDHFGPESGSSEWYCSTATDQQGNFLITDLPSNRSCRMYSQMDSTSGRGSLPVRRVSIGAAGSTNHLGELELQPTFKVAGTIQLSDGKPVPERSRAILSRREVSDSMTTALAKNGQFQFPAVPAEPVMLMLRVNGYELRPGDYRLISGPATNITVTSNITNWKIEMKPRSR